MEKLIKIVEKTIEKHARLEDKNTNSGFVITKKQQSNKFYNETVKRIVTVDEAKNLLKKSKAYFK